MDLDFIAKTAISAVAVAAMVGLAAWARIARPLKLLDNQQVHDLCAHEFPGAPLERIWISADGRGAIVKSNDQALLIFRAGDGYVSRTVAWGEALRGSVTADRLTLSLKDIGAPKARFAIGADAPWPPIVGAAA